MERSLWISFWLGAFNVESNIKETNTERVYSLLLRVVYIRKQRGPYLNVIKLVSDCRSQTAICCLKIDSQIGADDSERERIMHVQWISCWTRFKKVDYWFDLKLELSKWIKIEIKKKFVVMTTYDTKNNLKRSILRVLKTGKLSLDNAMHRQKGNVDVNLGRLMCID